MKIISIVGSTRNGNTLNMVNCASNSIESEVDVEIIHLKDLNFSFCNGCLTCDENGECSLEDDMGTVIEKVKNADGFIIGTPTRWGLLSGELKTFFDRLNPLAATEELAGKKAIIFAVGQTEENSDDGESIQLAYESVKTFCENADIEVVDKVLAYECIEKEDVTNNNSILKACIIAAQSLINSIK